MVLWRSTVSMRYLGFGQEYDAKGSLWTSTDTDKRHLLWHDYYTLVLLVYYSPWLFKKLSDLENVHSFSNSLAKWLKRMLISLLVCVCAQSCLSVCYHTDYSQPGSSVPGILQARILEWASISYFRASYGPRDQTHVSCFSCFGRQILHHCADWEAQNHSLDLLGLSCNTWDLAAWWGIEARTPALGAWSFSHWTTRQVPALVLF